MIYMRITLSEGQLFDLARKRARPAIRIERFYGRNFPLSKEMAIKLAEFRKCLRSTREYAKLTQAKSGEAASLTLQNE
jgi:hypothetical protein